MSGHKKNPKKDTKHGLGSEAERTASSVVGLVCFFFGFFLVAVYSGSISAATWRRSLSRHRPRDAASRRTHTRWPRGPSGSRRPRRDRPSRQSRRLVLLPSRETRSVRCAIAGGWIDL